jgi:hypothetical protein
MPEVDMRLVEIHPDDLVFAHEAEEATGVPQQVIRQWASRGKIRKFSGENRLSGNGHEYKTMFALPEVKELARSYRATPQRAPKAA